MTLQEFKQLFSAIAHCEGPLIDDQHGPCCRLVPVLEIIAACCEENIEIKVHKDLKGNVNGIDWEIVIKGEEA